ncbi:MAG: enoyl-CoA hydratase/isomerase family protein [Deltaproteobacteria bacterium]|nr:enoyl-CoA hydratase/isomerase family protein [Deltaproteobacteria bacterium]
MAESITTTVSGRILYLTINREKARNALNSAVVAELSMAFKEASAREDVCAVQLSGAGKAAFCAGADLKELCDQRTLEGRIAFFTSIAELLESMLRCRKPIVSKVHGFCLAGGMGLIAASDIVLASDSAVFGLPEVKVGLIPMIVEKVLARISDKRIISELALTGNSISATEALRHNLVSKVYPAVDLDSEADALTAKLALFDAEALAGIAASSRDLVDSGLIAKLHAAARKVAIFSMSPGTNGHLNKFAGRS